MHISGADAHYRQLYRSCAKHTVRVKFAKSMARLEWLHLTSQVRMEHYD